MHKETENGHPSAPADSQVPPSPGHSQSPQDSARCNNPTKGQRIPCRGTSRRVKFSVSPLFPLHSCRCKHSRSLQGRDHVSQGLQPRRGAPMAVFCTTVLSTPNASQCGTHQSAHTKMKTHLEIFQMLIVRSGQLSVGRHGYTTPAI